MLLGAAALISGMASPQSLRGSASPPRKVYTTNHVNPHNPVIDGRIDDPAWEKEEWAQDFIQREPHEGKPPTEPTSFKILYDEKNLYVAIRAHDKEPDKIVERLARRDSVDGDWVEIQLDSYNDRLSAFCLQVNAGGVKSDVLLSSDGEVEDEDWNPIWDVKTAVDQEGWTGYDQTGRFAFGDGFHDLFDTHPQNIFLVKFSYCFTL